jgi:soluble lytic murein transglycosylase-like protein
MRTHPPTRLPLLAPALALAAGLSLAFAAPLSADIYTYTDAEGTLHVTNAPQGDPRFKLTIRGRETAPGFSYGRGRAVPPARVVAHSAYDAVVRQAAARYRMDEALVRAVIHAESYFNASAVSPKGASGLMQLMPGTASRFGVHDIFDPVENVHAGVRYLSELQRMFNGDLRLTLAAYNAGEGAVQRHGGIPPYPETIEYVDRVQMLHGRYRASM